MSLSARAAAAGPDDVPQPVAEINVTPLVDVMLVLLIIFMVTMPLMMNQLPITLPKPDVFQADKPPQRLVVSFDLQGNYFIQRDDEPKQAVAYAELPGWLHQIALDRPDQVVIVCADPAVIYDRVVDLMGIAGNAGLGKVTICP